MSKRRKALLLGLWLGYAASVWALTQPQVDFQQAFFSLSVLNGLTYLIAITALLKK